MRCASGTSSPSSLLDELLLLLEPYEDEPEPYCGIEYEEPEDDEV